MARIPEDRIQSVQDAIDIVDVISRYVTLKRSGSSLKGLCPFHEEKTPSFAVFPESQRYKCFGCGEGGDVFSFLMRRNNLGFRDVLDELAGEAGVALPEEEPADPAAGHRRRRALEALHFAAGFYRAVLGRAAGAAARAYLDERGFGEETREIFSLGFSPDDYEGLLGYARGRGFGVEALFEAGLVRRNDRGEAFDMFRGRLMFPIHGPRGRVIGFGARALGDAQPKYLNSPDGALFHKGREMYGLHLARPAAVRAGRLLLVEGYTDVMQCHQSGLPEVAAALGTALTADNARQLRRFGVPVVLLYDGDEAGRRAAERAADVLLAEDVDGSVALLPPGEDPADLVRRAGREALEEVVAGATDLWNYRLDRVLERHERTLEGRGQASRELMETIGRIADPIRRDLAFKLLSERVGVPESTLRDEMPRDRRRPPREPAPDDAEQAPAPPVWREAESCFVQAALLEESVWDRVEQVHPPERFKDPDLRIVAGAIRDLRQQGESVTRGALLGRLADQDRAVRALQALDAGGDVIERVTVHLAGIARSDRLRRAAAAGTLEAALEARGDSAPAD